MTSDFLKLTKKREATFGPLLRDRLARELALLERARSALHSVLEAAALPDAPTAGTLRNAVAITLSARVTNDARMITIAIEHGYLQQGISIAAGLCDAAFALGAIAGDEAASQKWIQHEYHGQSSITTSKAIPLACESSRYVKRLDQQIEYFRECYKFLSATKHANGKFLRRLGITDETEDDYSLAIGPSAQPVHQALGSLVLLSTVEVLLLGADGFRNKQLPDNIALQELLASCRDERQHLFDQFQRGVQAAKEIAAQERESLSAPVPQFDANGIRLT